MALVSLAIFLLGLCVGSFLNVVILRTFEGRSVAAGRSRCMACNVVLRARDLVPVASWLWLRGRCSSCKAVVSWQYPVVEFATGALFLFAYLRYANDWWITGVGLTESWPWPLVRDCLFLSILVVVFVYDLRYYLILDRFTIPAMILALLFNVLLGIPAWSLLVGGFVIGGFFALQHVVSKGAWVGGGDIRMGLLMGFLLGLQNGLVALLIAYVIGAIFGIFLLARGKAHLKTQLPFGTFLAVGTAIAMFAGDELVHWYLGLF